MFNNHNKKMFALAGKSVNKYGLDQTKKIIYNFDEYGFRQGNNYNIKPKYIFFGSSILSGIGVKEEDRFSYYIQPSWNFGLCGQYTDYESIQNYFSFLSTYKFKNSLKVIFCWKNSNVKILEKLIDKIPDLGNIFHCVPIKINRQNTCLYLKNIDYDVSGTHWGPITHNKFAKLLWQLLK